MISSFCTVDNLQLSNYAAGILIADILHKHCAVKLISKGDSMFPLIVNKDFITVSPWESKSPEVGDVVAFFDHTTHRFMIHRIIHEKEMKYETKGDFCFNIDGYFTIDQLLGYVSNINNQHHIFPFSIQLKLKKAISFLSRTNILTFIARIVKKFFLK